MLMSSLHRKVLLTYLSKAFEAVPLTNTLAHKVVYLIQSLPKAPTFCEFFYFKSEGPISVSVDTGLIEAESGGGIAYYTAGGELVDHPGVDDAHLFIKPGPHYVQVYKKNHAFFREMQTFVEQVITLGRSCGNYAGLASVAYVNAHIDEFAPEAATDRVDFISMILQEYNRQYTPAKVAELVEILKTHKFV